MDGLTRFSVVDLGIYFSPDRSSLQFLPFDTGKAILVFSDLRRERGRLWSVSPNGRWALLNKSGSAQSDLMLVENFR